MIFFLITACGPLKEQEEWEQDWNSFIESNPAAFISDDNAIHLYWNQYAWNEAHTMQETLAAWFPPEWNTHKQSIGNIFAGFTITDPLSMKSITLDVALCQSNKKNFWNSFLPNNSTAPIVISEYDPIIQRFKQPNLKFPWSIFTAIPVLQKTMLIDETYQSLVLGAHLFISQPQTLQTFQKSYFPTAKELQEYESKHKAPMPKANLPAVTWNSQIPEQALLWINFHLPKEFQEKLLAAYNEIAADETQTKIFPLYDISDIQIQTMLEGWQSIQFIIMPEQIELHLRFETDTQSLFCSSVLRKLKSPIIAQLKLQQETLEIATLIDNLEISYKENITYLQLPISSSEPPEPEGPSTNSHDTDKSDPQEKKEDNEAEAQQQPENQ